MTMDNLLYRTLHPWEFTGETLHENVQLWDAKWKSDWEEHAAALFCGYELHDVLCDAIAEDYMRRKHAGDNNYSAFNADVFEQLTQIIQKIENTGDWNYFKEAQALMKDLTLDEKELFSRVVQRLFPDQIDKSHLL